MGDVPLVPVSSTLLVGPMYPLCQLGDVVSFRTCACFESLGKAASHALAAVAPEPRK